MNLRILFKFFTSFLLIAAGFALSACQNLGGYGSLPPGSQAYNNGTVQPAYSMPGKRPATGKKAFVFSPAHHAWGAYDVDGNLINEGRASGGQEYCADINRPCRTPSGHYRVVRKGGPDCKSSKFPVGKGGAPMPYCTFFHGGFAVHGSSDVPNRNASHGCVRVTPDSARWLSQNFFKIHTQVIVEPYNYSYR